MKQQFAGWLLFRLVVTHHSGTPGDLLHDFQKEKAEAAATNDADLWLARLHEPVMLLAPATSLQLRIGELRERSGQTSQYRLDFIPQFIAKFIAIRLVECLRAFVDLFRRRVPLRGKPANG
jgi:hypothetical protein